MNIKNNQTRFKPWKFVASCSCTLTARWWSSLKTFSYRQSQSGGQLLKCRTTSKYLGLSLTSKVIRVLMIKILVSTARTQEDLANKQNFMKKYQKLAEIYSKNLENREFLEYHPSNNCHETGPRASKIALPVVLENFDKTCKKHIHCFCLFFREIFFD